MISSVLRWWRDRNAPWVKPTTVWFNDRYCTELESRLDEIGEGFDGPVTYFRDRITGQAWAYQIVEAAPVDIMGYVPVSASFFETATKAS